ncbi:MAG: dihydropteroate synthase, partial [candidate division WOR-3 bacterium]
PVLRPLAKKVKLPISIDTTSAAVAKEAIDNGADMVNDISGLRFDPRMAKTIAGAGVPVVVMHIKGRPRTMQKNPVYYDLMGEIIRGLRQSLAIGRRAGIEPGRMLVDPGIGFGKTLEHNLEILRRLKELHSLGAPVVVGPSRKSFIGMVLNLPPAERLEGTLAACVIAAENGANILRVHDVLAVKRALAIRDAIRLMPGIKGKTPD